MKSLTLILAGLFFVNSASAAVTNATSAIINIYRAYLTESASCTGTLVTIVDNGDVAQPFDMLTSPELGKKSVPAKKYQCLILEMSDKITFVPSSTTGNCTGGTSYTRYVCQSGNSTTNPATGASTACTGTSQTGEDKVWVYVSRWSNTVDGVGNTNAFAPPTADGDAVNAVPLANEIDATLGGGFFIFNLTGKVDGGQNPCDMKPPVFGFRANPS